MVHSWWLYSAPRTARSHVGAPSALTRRIGSEEFTDRSNTPELPVASIDAIIAREILDSRGNPVADDSATLAAR